MYRWIYLGLESKLVRFYYQKISGTPQLYLNVAIEENAASMLLMYGFFLSLWQLNVLTKRLCIDLDCNIYLFTEEKSPDGVK